MPGKPLTAHNPTFGCRQASNSAEMREVLGRLLQAESSSGQAQQAQQAQPEQPAPEQQQAPDQQQAQQQPPLQVQPPEAAVEPLVAADFAMMGEEEQEVVADHEPPQPAADAAADAGPQQSREPLAQEPESGAADTADADAAQPEQGQGGPGGAAAAAAAADEPAPARPLRVGEVGWFQVRGYPHWPFLVLTREEALARGLPGACIHV